MVLAVVMRPVGGALSDRFGPVNMPLWYFAVVTLLAAVIAFHLAATGLTTLLFTLGPVRRGAQD